MSEGFAPLFEFLQNPYALAAMGTAAALLGGYYLITKAKFGFGGLFSDCCCPVHGGKAAIAASALPVPRQGKC